jgi:hypothetical protein
VLALALGALATLQRFEGLVSRQSGGSEALDRDDPVLVAALGMIALSRSLGRWLEEAVESTDPPAVPAGPAPIQSRELLR